MRQKPKDFIRSFKSNHSVNSASLELGIHKTTVYRWLKRARKPYPYGPASYKLHAHRKSTRPKKIPYVLTNDRKVLIEEMRLKHGFDARKIIFALLNTISFTKEHQTKMP